MSGPEHGLWVPAITLSTLDHSTLYDWWHRNQKCALAKRKPFKHNYQGLLTASC
jgi:hypothetical protein